MVLLDQSRLEYLKGDVIDRLTVKTTTHLLFESMNYDQQDSSLNPIYRMDFVEGTERVINLGEWIFLKVKLKFFMALEKC